MGAAIWPEDPIPPCDLHRIAGARRSLAGGVGTLPGARAFTRMPPGPSSPDGTLVDGRFLGNARLS